ncbi:kinase-like protein [Thelephora ganbajun]|uniref:Kinase-like protein n=1 Tax=Thelephora ganbajun TaxID=370292 RepID=A0ACB6ZB34_THEGA|nr:kinase-like protein [Thelephora ganbajun]
MWAPEILNGGPVSKEGDVFAFAVVASEILKEDVPSDTKVSLEGHHQEARKPLHDELWPFIRRCLKREPRERPTTDQLLEFFQNFRFLREQAKPKAQILPSASGPGEHPSLHATNPLPGQNFPRETIDGDGTNANNLDSMSDGDALHEPTIQPSADSTRNGDDDPATCGTDLESNGVTDNTPHTGQPSQPKDFDAATPLVNYRDAAGMAGGAKDAHIPSPEDGSGIPETPATVTAHTASTKISLTKITNWNEKSGDISQMLTTAFESKDYLDCVKNLRALDIDPLSYINSLDKIIDSLSTNSDLRKRCIRELSRTCGAHGILPTSYAITFTLSKPGPRPFASGGSSDIWRLTDENACDRIFTVKSLRVYEQDPVDEINKRYCEAVIALKRANHPNILPIEGVARELFEFCMVSQWIPGGLMGHVEKCPEANRLELLIGVTHGLYYLHGNKIVHGDLRSTNILVDANGSPRLSGFGLCSITKHTNSVNASTPNDGSMVRYCAPELLDTNWVTQVEKKKPTNKSDVYSLSMVIVELVTGKVPFPDLTDAHITIGVPKGIRPPKPRPFKAPGMTPVVWKIAKKCWREKAEERLEVKDVLQYLENPPNHDGKLSQALRSTAAKGSSQLSAIHQKAIRFLPSNPKT